MTFLVVQLLIQITFTLYNQIDMNFRKIRAILDLILDYWARTIGALLGLTALILLMTNQIDESTFWKYISAMVAIGFIPKFKDNKKTNDDDAAR